MVELAQPTIRAYHGDLYHDALWLNENANGDSYVFYWSFDETGTAIGTHEKDAHREHKYRLTITLVNGVSRLKIEGA
jgi:hypothetical protein